MFRNDQDLWPIKCPHCLHEFKETVGRMKTGADLRCPDCQTVRYEMEEFMSALDLARQGLYDFSRTIVRGK